MTGDQMFSLHSSQEGTICRSVSCRGEFLDHCEQLMGAGGRGVVPRAPSSLSSWVMSQHPKALDHADTGGHSDSRWQGGGDPGGTEREGRLAEGTSQFICFTYLPGAGPQQKGQYSDTARKTPSPAAFSGLASVVCAKSISIMAMCLLQHSGR